MLRFTILSVLVFLVGWLVRLNSPQSIFGILQGLGFIGLVVSGGYYSLKVLRMLLRRMLWKVRNKIIISFAFVGLIPVVILAGIFWFSVGLIFRQLSVVYLEYEFTQISEKLAANANQTVLRFYQSEVSNEELLGELLRQEGSRLVEMEPGLGDASFSLLIKQGGREEARYREVFRSPQPTTGEIRLIPHWARDGYSGMVSEESTLSFRHVVPIKTNRSTYLVSIRLPFNQRLIDHIRQKTEIAEIQLVDTSTGAPAISQFFESDSRFLNLRWAHVLEPIHWKEGVNPESSGTGVLLEVPIEVLLNRYFTHTTGFGGFIIYLIVGLAFVFVLVEVVSILIGTAIARSITRSIYNIDAGAKNIQEGNLEFRIPSKDRDQLDSVATAFNKMSESIVGLMQQVSEKERLEKEVEIAREVQTHLFPRELPAIRQVQLSASCLPARSVSGDYYDFIPYGAEQLDIMIADISGKGISAAMLMASLQSSFRSLVIHQSTGYGDLGVSDVVRTLNRQLYTHTSADKFATLVLARVDAAEMTLSYCNAGHNPPIIISDGEVSRLTKGGIVAGIFSDPEYEEEQLKLHPGDMVVFYTDGVSEAENPEGEEFGEQRLEDIVKANAFLTADDIRDLIIQQVVAWASGQEQWDDITVVTLKMNGSDGQRL